MLSKDLAKKIASILEDNHGKDVVVLDINDVSSLADNFIIASGMTDQHVSSLEERLTRELRKLGISHNKKEGNHKNGWIVVDYGVNVVHIMSEKSRKYYKIDSLWDKAKKVINYI